MGKKWERVAFEDIKVGDVIRRTATFGDGTKRRTVGTAANCDKTKVSTESGCFLAQMPDNDAVIERRVVKPKLPVEPGTVIDAVAVRKGLGWPHSEIRREIRLTRGRKLWVGIEYRTGCQFLAEDTDIESWELVAPARAL